MMNSVNIDARDQRKAENIRRQYISGEENKMEQLRKLDGKVKAPGRVVAGSLGTVGALVMGAGMSFVMVWENMQSGLALGIPGMLALILAYPVYTWITGRRKKKYADQMMRLSSELVNR